MIGENLRQQQLGLSPGKHLSISTRLRRGTPNHRQRHQLIHQQYFSIADPGDSVDNPVPYVRSDHALVHDSNRGVAGNDFT